MKLTKNHKSRILHALVVPKRLEYNKQSKKEEVAIANMVYKEAFGESTIRKMKKLPYGWLPKSKSVGVRVGGRDYSFDMEKEAPFPYEKKKGFGIPILVNVDDSESNIWKAVTEYQSKRTAHLTQMQEMTTEIVAALNSFNTDKQLLEKWPEIEKEVKLIVGESASSTTLAPRLDKINEKLGR